MIPVSRKSYAQCRRCCFCNWWSNRIAARWLGKNVLDIFWLRIMAFALRNGYAASNSRRVMLCTQSPAGVPVHSNTCFLASSRVARQANRSSRSSKWSSACRSKLLVVLAKIGRNWSQMQLTHPGSLTVKIDWGEFDWFFGVFESHTSFQLRISSSDFVYRSIHIHIRTMAFLNLQN